MAERDKNRLYFVLALIVGVILFLLWPRGGRVATVGGDVSLMVPSLGDLPGIIVNSRGRDPFTPLDFSSEGVGEGWPVAPPSSAYSDGADGEGCCCGSGSNGPASLPPSTTSYQPRFLEAQPVSTPSTLSRQSMASSETTNADANPWWEEYGASGPDSILIPEEVRHEYDSGRRYTGPPKGRKRNFKCVRKNRNDRFGRHYIEVVCP